MNVTVAVTPFSSQGPVVNVAGPEMEHENGTRYYSVCLDQSFGSILALLEISKDVDLRVLANAQGRLAVDWNWWVRQTLETVDWFTFFGVEHLHVSLYVECGIFDLSEMPITQNHEKCENPICYTFSTVSTLDEMFSEFPETYLTPVSVEQKLVDMYYALFGTWTFTNFPLLN